MPERHHGKHEQTPKQGNDNPHAFLSMQWLLPPDTL
jgi:hypothetical protein